MKKYLLLVGVCAATLGCAAVCYSAATDEGAKVFQEVCTPCHSAGSRPLDNLQLSRAQWQDEIDRMGSLGADVPSKKIPALLDFLVATHGPQQKK